MRQSRERGRRRPPKTIAPQTPSARCTSAPRIPRGGKLDVGVAVTPLNVRAGVLWPTNSPQTVSLVIHLQSGITLNFLVLDSAGIYHESKQPSMLLAKLVLCQAIRSRKVDGDLQGHSGQVLSCKFRLTPAVFSGLS